MASLVLKKQWKLTAWVIASIIGYLAIMGLTYTGADDGAIQLFHIESEWQSLGIIISTPFVFAFLPGQKAAIASWFIIVFFMVRLYYIGSAIPLFRWRIHFQEQVLEQMKKETLQNSYYTMMHPAL